MAARFASPGARVRALLYLLLLQLMRLLRASCRYRIHGEAGLPPRTDGLRGGFVMALWHQNLLAALLAETGRRSFSTMISRSRDGDAIAHVVVKLGHHPARGSSRRGQRDKGGREARDEMVEKLRARYPGAVTVDGPQGPAYEVKFGVIDMAVKAGVPIVPYFVIASRYWSLRSWDRLRLPKPFARIDVYYAEPIPVPAATAREDYPALQARIKTALDALEARYGSGAGGADNASGGGPGTGAGVPPGEAEQGPGATGATGR